MRSRGRRALWAAWAGLVAFEVVIFAWVGGLWFRSPENLQVEPSALLAGAAGLLLLVGAQAIVWAWLDLRLLLPLRALERGVETQAHGHTACDFELPDNHLLGALPERIVELRSALEATSAEAAPAKREDRELQRVQKEGLAQVLNALRQGVLVCDERARIIMYNPAASRLLGGNDHFGLQRPAGDFFPVVPLRQARELLEHRRGQGRDGEPVEFIVSLPERDCLVRCHLDSIRFDAGRPQPDSAGFVLGLEDITRTQRHAEQQHGMLRSGLDTVHGGMQSLWSALDSGQDTSVPGEVSEALGRLRVDLEKLAGVVRTLSSRVWVLSDVCTTDLVAGVNSQLDGPYLEPVGDPHWFRGDAPRLVAMLVSVVDSVPKGEPEGIDLLGRPERGYLNLDLLWRGSSRTAGRLRDWTASRLETVPGTPSVREVLEEHGAAIRPVADTTTGRSGFTLRLPASLMERPSVSREPPARPECYDFDLYARAHGDMPVLDRPLKELTYVVFDTETTGLRPSGGDEVVSIGAVRIVNRRVISGETFDTLVNPQRPIPPGSVRFHGITDAMVAGAPTIETVLPRFQRFVGDAVLVAHNAPFDMKFISLKAPVTGVRLSNQVLDLLPLSVFLHDHASDHSLDATAHRLGVKVTGRHTALGDALVTANVYSRMLGLLEARGVSTLGQALAVCEKISAVRRQQARF